MLSDLKKSLRLKFDAEPVLRGNIRIEEGRTLAKKGWTLRNRRDIGTTIGLPTTEYNHGNLRKSWWASSRRRTLHRVSNRIFTKKLVSRYSLKTLATMNVNSELTSRDIHGLLAIVRFLLRSEVAPVERKILLKTKYVLLNKLKSREFQRNRRVRRVTEARLSDKICTFNKTNCEDSQLTEPKRDEIDDIFSRLGL